MQAENTGGGTVQGNSHDNSLAAAAWNAELDRLEADVRRTELLLADPTEALLTWHTRPAWHTPSLRPIPEHLVPRATALAAQQDELRERLARALSANIRQRGFADRVSDATAGPTRPTYLDITA